MELYRVNKEIIKNPNLKNDKSELDNSILKFDGNWDQSEVVKGILEASFRERDIVFRPIEKTQRKSKILWLIFIPLINLFTHFILIQASIDYSRHFFKFI